MIQLDHIFRRRDGTVLPYVREIQELKDLIIARLKGPIDVTTVPIVSMDFTGRLSRYLDKNILLDFQEVTHVDSSTIANLIFLLIQLQHHHRKFGITHVSATLESYIEIDNVRALIRIYPDEAAALKDLSD